MKREDVKVGMRVRVNTPDNPRYHGKFGTVALLNPVNVKVKLDTGHLLNAHPTFLEDATDMANAPTSPYQAAVDAIPPAAGSVVRKEGAGKMPAGLYVVLGESRRAGGGMKVAKLGGDNNRYWTVPVSSCKVVPVEELLGARV